MEQALIQARAAQSLDEVPIGGILYHLPSKENLFQGHNTTRATQNPLTHIEMLAIKHGLKKLGGPFLENCVLYVTLEPCAMCAAALSLARLDMLVFGAYNPKGGAVTHGARLFETSHGFKPKVLGGVLEDASARLLKKFFQKKRSSGFSDPNMGF